MYSMRCVQICFPLICYLSCNFRTRSGHNLDLLSNRVALMNDTVKEVYRRLDDHHMRSSNVFTDVEEKIMEFRTQQMHTDDRLTRMEVRVGLQRSSLFISKICCFSV